MNMTRLFGTAVLAAVVCAPVALAQSASSAPASAAKAQISTADSARADAYYNFTMGHLQEEQFETNSNSDMATQSIDSYKKALELEPDSAVILERLAEIYAKSQHIREAVVQAQAALKLDPDNVDAHRLLARIYVRTLGDMNAGDVQQESLEKAIEQFQGDSEDRTERHVLAAVACAAVSLPKQAFGSGENAPAGDRSTIRTTARRSNSLASS